MSKNVSTKSGNTSSVTLQTISFCGNTGAPSIGILTPQGTYITAFSSFVQQINNSSNPIAKALSVRYDATTISDLQYWDLFQSIIGTGIIYLNLDISNGGRVRMKFISGYTGGTAIDILNNLYSFECTIEGDKSKADVAVEVPFYDDLLNTFSSAKYILRFDMGISAKQFIGSVLQQSQNIVTKFIARIIVLESGVSGLYPLVSTIDSNSMLTSTLPPYFTNYNPNNCGQISKTVKSTSNSSSQYLMRVWYGCAPTINTTGTS